MPELFFLPFKWYFYFLNDPVSDLFDPCFHIAKSLSTNWPGSIENKNEVNESVRAFIFWFRIMLIFLDLYLKWWDKAVDILKVVSKRWWQIPRSRPRRYSSMRLIFASSEKLSLYMIFSFDWFGLILFIALESNRI